MISSISSQVSFALALLLCILLSRHFSVQTVAKKAPRLIPRVCEVAQVARSWPSLAAIFRGQYGFSPDKIYDISSRSRCISRIKSVASLQRHHRLFRRRVSATNEPNESTDAETSIEIILRNNLFLRIRSRSFRSFLKGRFLPIHAHFLPVFESLNQEQNWNELAK